MTDFKFPHSFLPPGPPRHPSEMDLADQTAELRAGRWNKKEFTKTGAGGARGLKGMTLGIVGVGAIGQEVIRRATAFGMHVVAWSRSITPKLQK